LDVARITGKDEGSVAEKITWTNTTVKLGDLKPWGRNPKSISKAHAKRLLASWEKFGQFQTVAIGPDYEVYDGHQRLSVLRAAYGDAYAVDARQSSRALDDTERRQLVIEAHAGTTGQFDWDALSGWDAAQLQEWGLDSETLQDWKTGIAAVNELVGLPDIAFDQFDGEGDGGGSRMQNGTVVRVVIGAIMLDIPDPTHELYKRTEAADVNAVKDGLFEALLEAGIL